jgi:hypothetical protein
MNKLAVFSLFLLTACTQQSNQPTDPPPVTCDGETYFLDADGDGFGDPDAGSCEPLEGYVKKSGDCDDNDPSITDGRTFFRDRDGDGFGVGSETVRACTPPAGFVDNDRDCDDDASTINPVAPEICDDIDNNCNGMIDMDDPGLDLSTATSYFADTDGDTFGAGTPQLACSQPVGFVANNTDCNDTDNKSKPGGAEICDGRDNNCDGGVDGTPAAPNQCAALVGTYSGSYTHLAQEKVGNTVVNSMSCSGTGNGSLILNRNNALQGTFTCVYTGGLTVFTRNQTVTLRADVGLDGAVTGTIEHTYDTFGSLKRTYMVTGTQTATTLSLTGTGQFLPNPMSAVPWQVSFTFTANK